MRPCLRLNQPRPNGKLLLAIVFGRTLDHARGAEIRAMGRRLRPPPIRTRRINGLMERSEPSVHWKWFVADSGHDQKIPGSRRGDVCHTNALRAFTRSLFGN